MARGSRPLRVERTPDGHRVEQQNVRPVTRSRGPLVSAAPRSDRSTPSVTGLPGRTAVPERDRRAMLRLMTLVARLHHECGVRQCDIATRLGLSQPRVSRLLDQAEQHGIVRTVVVAPDGLYPELEETVEAAYGIRECHVVEVHGGDPTIPHELGAAAGRYFGQAGRWGPRVGFTSWSSTLREMARQLDPVRHSGTTHVIEMCGDLGPPPLQHQADRATLQLAQALGAEPVLLRTPGVIADPALRQTVVRNPHVGRVLAMLDHLDLAFVGIGPTDIHLPLRAGENYFSTAQLATIRAAGAVGQLDQRFINAKGEPLTTPLEDAVVAITLDQLRRADTRVVVAGGPGKLAPLRAALRGGWVDVLVTDLTSARHLITHAEESTAGAQLSHPHTVCTMGSLNTSSRWQR